MTITLPGHNNSQQQLTHTALTRSFKLHGNFLSRKKTDSGSWSQTGLGTHKSVDQKSAVGARESECGSR